jgi:5-methylcytosine-specific restriction enzyme subunit McrC
MVFDAAGDVDIEAGLAARIPLRNKFVLLLYASDLARYQGEFSGLLERLPNKAEADFLSLIGRILEFAVQRRLKRNLSKGYIGRKAVLTRVRGRIDLMPTLVNQLMDRGQVACRFEELTPDTPRNRLVRHALAKISSRVSDDSLANVCRTLARELGDMGVLGRLPSTTELAKDIIGRNDALDHLMVATARLVVVPELPWGAKGDRKTGSPTDDLVFWRIYEKAVARIADMAFPGRTKAQSQLRWPFDAAAIASETRALWPVMQRDLVVQCNDGSVLIVDTKFATMLTDRDGRAQFKTTHLYQMFSYLMTHDRASGQKAHGLLLYPSLGEAEIEHVACISGRSMRLATVNLDAPALKIVARIQALVDPFRPVLATTHAMTENSLERVS